MTAAFIPDLSADVGGTYATGSTAPYTYAQIAAVLGDPMESDRYKVSTEWVVREAESGLIVTLYDWKATSLYDSGLPSVKTFRAHPYAWHLGSHHPAVAARFSEWLQKQVEGV